MSKGKKLTQDELEKRVESDLSFRRAIFKSLLEHLRKGYSLDCFPDLSDKEIYRLLKKFPGEFSEKELTKASREAKQFWEDIGYRQSDGKCIGNSKAWSFNMINRYRWSDRLDLQAEHKGTVSVNIVSYASQRTSEDIES